MKTNMEKVDVRIVAGSLKGRRLTVLVHAGLRPTPQMVREALFSILGNAVPDRPFYDVFAGTGVVGFEAISRGASRAQLIERDASQAAELHKAAVGWKLTDRVQILRADAYRWAERWIPGTEGVNVFLSPPFPDLTGEKAEAFAKLIEVLWAKLPPESVLVVQVESGYDTGTLPDVAEWDIREYSRNVLMFRTKDAVAREVESQTDSAE
jgi:16S rRNA (guanine966-N2)-methyltransferase